MERLRYDKRHWSREADAEKALNQYLELGGKAYNRAKFELFRKLTGDVTGKKLLDYGGGAGIMAIPYAQDGADVVLVDAETNALYTACFYAHREHVEERVRTIQSEKFHYELKKERFDIIIAKDILEHIDEDRRFLMDLSECQDRGGVLLLSTQNSLSINYLIEGSFQKYWRKNKDWRGWDQTHLRFYTYSSLRALLTSAGYRPAKWASVFIIPYNILSWLFLGKMKIETPFLHKFDLLFGSSFPFNRLGWNIIVKAEKVS